MREVPSSYSSSSLLLFKFLFIIFCNEETICDSKVINIINIINIILQLFFSLVKTGFKKKFK